LGLLAIAVSWLAVAWLSGHVNLGLLAIAVDWLLSDDNGGGAVVVVAAHRLHRVGKHVVGGQVAGRSDSDRHPEVDDREEMVEKVPPNIAVA